MKKILFFLMPICAALALLAIVIVKKYVPDYWKIFMIVIAIVYVADIIIVTGFLRKKAKNKNKEREVPVDAIEYSKKQTEELKHKLKQINNRKDIL